MRACEFEMLHCPQKMGWKRIFSFWNGSFLVDMSVFTRTCSSRQCRRTLPFASGSSTPVLPQLVDPVWAQSRHVQRQLLKMAPQIVATFPDDWWVHYVFFGPRSIRFVKARSSWGKGWGMSWDNMTRLLLCKTAHSETTSGICASSGSKFAIAQRGGGGGGFAKDESWHIKKHEYIKILQ